MKTTKTVLVGLLAGAAAGALLGVLLAPGKGSEIRRKIMDKSGEFTEGLIDKFFEFVDGLAKKGDNLLQDADDQLAKGQQKFEEAKRNVDNTAM